MRRSQWRTITKVADPAAKPYKSKMKMMLFEWIGYQLIE